MSVIKRTSMIAVTLFLFVGATCAQETTKEKTGAISASIPALGFVNRPSRLLAQLQHAEGAAVQPFEVATIKPSRADDNMTRLFMSPGKFTTEAETIKEVIRFAYDIKSDDQLSGGPSWINSEKFDIEAKEEHSVAENLQKLPFQEQAKQIRLMVQALLADRFRLKVSHQTKELPVYALVVAKGGPKFTETQVPPPSPDGMAAPNRGFRGIRMMGPGQLTGTNINIGLLAEILSRQRELGRLVIDQTGLKGNYDWKLKWTPDQGDPMFKGPDGAVGNMWANGTCPLDCPLRFRDDGIGEGLRGQSHGQNERSGEGCPRAATRGDGREFSHADGRRRNNLRSGRRFYADRRPGTRTSGT